MAEFEDIKMRKDTFDRYNHPDFYEGDDSIGVQTANDFWEHIEDDAAWLMGEVERLCAELAKFRFCTGWEVFIAGDGQKSIRRADCGMLGDHYHKENQKERERG